MAKRGMLDIASEKVKSLLGDSFVAQKLQEAADARAANEAAGGVNPWSYLGGAASQLAVNAIGAPGDLANTARAIGGSYPELDKGGMSLTPTKIAALGLMGIDPRVQADPHKQRFSSDWWVDKGNQALSYLTGNDRTAYLPNPGEEGYAARAIAGFAPSRLNLAGVETPAMFLGERAKTALPDVLEYAKAMDKAGKSADEIWTTTGKLGQPWFKGADGKWRFEISDANADYRPGRAAQESLANAESLFAQYDDALYLRNYMDREGKSVGEAKDWYRQTFGRDPHEYAGQLAKGSDAEFLKNAAYNAEKNAPSRMNWASPLNNVLDHPDMYSAHPEMKDTRYYMMQPKDMMGGVGGQFGTGGIGINPDVAYMLGSGKSTTLHEAQHAVQDLEGFGRGGSPEGLAESLRAEAERLSRKASDMIYADEANRPAALDLIKQANRLRDAGGIADWAPMEGYKRLAGEAEARNTQARMAMTMDERLQFPPWLTQDVPTDQQIVRFGDGPAMAVERNGEPITPKMMQEPQGRPSLDDWMNGDGAPGYALHISDAGNSESITSGGLRAGKDGYVYLWDQGLDPDSERIMREARMTRNPNLSWDEAGAVPDAYYAVDLSKLGGKVDRDPMTGGVRVSGDIPKSALIKMGGSNGEPITPKMFK